MVCSVPGTERVLAISLPEIRAGCLVLLVLARLRGLTAVAGLSEAILAGVDHHQQLHQVAVDLLAAALFDVDILAVDALAGWRPSW